MNPRLLEQRIPLIFFGIILVFSAIGAIFGGPLARTPKTAFTYSTQGACTGTPIKVTFDYTGGPANPWTCQQQCTDHIQHYILYKNGLATQCETLPGCNDSGEDNSMTCTPPKK